MWAITSRKYSNVQCGFGSDPRRWRWARWAVSVSCCSAAKRPNQTGRFCYSSSQEPLFGVALFLLVRTSRPGRDIALRCPRPRPAGGTKTHASPLGRRSAPSLPKPCKGRDIALRCPRPRAAGGTNPRAVRTLPHLRRCYAARTVQRAVPTKNHAKVGTSRCDVLARVQRAERTT